MREYQTRLGKSDSILKEGAYNIIRKKRNSNIGIVIGIFLIVLLIRFLPFPYRYNLTVQGKEVTVDGEVLENVIIKIRVWKLDYLFKEDKLEGNIEIISNEMTIKTMYIGSIYQKSEKMYRATIAYFNSEYNDTYFGKIVFNDKFDIFQIIIGDGYDEERYFVGSKNNQIKPKDILLECQGVISN